MKKFFCLLVAIWTSTCLVKGQTLLSVPVFQEGNRLANPFAGGLNEAQFSTLDLDRDGELDLVVFDRSGSIVLPFLNREGSYHYAPSYMNSFPRVSNWMLIRDYNKDGKGDLFIDEPENSGIQVYTNVSENDLSFQLAVPLLNSQDNIPLFVPSTDIPGIVDMNGDERLDILTFDAVGSFLQLFQNATPPEMDSPQLLFTLENACWGNVREDGLSNEVFLDEFCREPSSNSRNSLHAGSTVTPIPGNEVGKKDVLLGDISHENLVYLHNGGELENPLIDQVDPNFPANSTSLFLPFFPAAFLEDLTFDGIPDLVVAPNASGISDNFQNIWLYQGSSVADSLSFSLVQNDFLQEGMIDCGAIAHPATFDYNGDGLQDLIIGNKAYQTGGTFPSASLTLYENTGTAQGPEFTLVDRNYLDIGSFFSNVIQEIRPTFGDLDQDGDDDMLLGDINGNIHLFENDPQAGIASFSLSAFSYEGIDVGQNASPQLIDINGDDILDLLIGEGNGTLNYFENTGTQLLPDFPETPTQANWGNIDVSPDCCTGFSVPFLYPNSEGTFDLRIGSESGEIVLVKDMDPTNLEESASFSPSVQDWGVGGRSSPWAVDLDADGKLEWIIGNSRGGIGIFLAPNESPVSNQPSIKAEEIRLFPNPSKHALLEIHFPQTWEREKSSFRYSLYKGSYLTKIIILRKRTYKSSFLASHQVPIYSLFILHLEFRSPKSGCIYLNLFVCKIYLLLFKTLPNSF